MLLLCAGLNNTCFAGSSPFHHITLPWGPFPESPENLSGPISNIQNKIYRIKARALNNRPAHFVLLTGSFINMLFANNVPETDFQAKQFLGILIHARRAYEVCSPAILFFTYYFHQVKFQGVFSCLREILAVLK